MAESPIMDSPELKPLPDSDNESPRNEKEIEEARAFVDSYCHAFDSSQHSELSHLTAPDITFEWFGQKVRGSQTLRHFIMTRVPETKHLCANVECIEKGSVHVNGKLQLARPGVLRKVHKQWHWERNFSLRLHYIAQTRLLQRVVYENANRCKRALFKCN